MKVKDVMTKTAHTCSLDTSLESAAMSMWNNDCGCVPVIDEHHAPVAMVTDRDIAMGATLQHKPLWDMKVSDITNGRALFCCQDSDDIHQAVKLMQEHGVRRLPVVYDNGKLAGILSMGDILAKADINAKAPLPLKDVMGMLKGVTGHHGELVQVA